MTAGEINDVFYEMFLLSMQIAGPVLFIAMAVGIVISILQAATQIHEQTLTFLPKLIVIAVILVIMGNSMLVSLQDFTKNIFHMIATG